MSQSDQINSENSSLVQMEDSMNESLSEQDLNNLTQQSAND